MARFGDTAVTIGERRLVAVVLIGRAGEPGEPAPPDEALRRAVEPYRGRLEPVAGGGALAVVLEGGPQVATDRAARAARCALAIRAVAARHPLAIAMGRAEAAGERPGDLLDRAARLLAAAAGAPAEPGEPAPIALDEVSAGLLDARFDTSDREAGVLLRGERPLLHGARTLLGRPTSHVGRDWELDALAGLLDECVEDARARAAIITGVAGMGKSRLAAELVSRVEQRAAGVAVWIGRGDSLRAGSTLDLLAQALRGALGLRGGEPPAERLGRIRARIAEHVPAADRPRVADFLGELVGAAPPGEESSPALRAARQDAHLMNEQMCRAWLDFLGAEAGAHPVLLLLDDLHWSDVGTVRFVDTALRDRRDLPWMVLALARPEVFDVFPKLWMERPNRQEIRLKGLGRRASERLARQVLGDSVVGETVDHLVKQADGNAFYLEELIRAVAEGKDAVLPETVLAMVESRVARLPAEARQVLRAASVFGEVCWESGVARLVGDAMDAPMVGAWLGRLVEQEVLVERSEGRFPGERELAFRHALLREGAYATLPEADRRLAHRLAGGWLERHGEAEPMVLGGHFERGGEGTRAAGYYRRAAEQAMQVHDMDAVLARTGLGLACAPPPELRHALLGLRAAAGTSQARIVMDEVDDLLRGALPGSVPWLQGMLAFQLGTLLAGRIPELLASIARLRGVTVGRGAAQWMAIVFASGTIVLDMFGQIAQATALEEPFRALIEERGDEEPMACVWWSVSAGSRAAFAHDDPWRGREHCLAIRAVFEAIGGDTVYLSMRLLLGLHEWYLGAPDATASILAAIPAADSRLGTVSSLRRFALSWLHADRGAPDEARRLATQLADDGRARKNRLEEARGRWALAEAHRRAGDLAAAEREITAALEAAVPLDGPGMLGTLAAIRLAAGRAAEALAAAEDAAARMAAIGGCGMFRGAFVRLVHAEALHATGARDAARGAITEARARLHAIAGRIPDPAYRASFLEGVPENARTLALARAWLGDAPAR